MSNPQFKPIGEFADTVEASTLGGGVEDESGGGGGAESHAPSEDRRSYTDASGVTVVRSLCMSCYEQGTTRLLLTSIPFFRDVIIMAFSCEECGYRSSEVQSAEVQDRGCRFVVSCETLADLNRQLVKGDKAGVMMTELELEIPPGTQGGKFTTVEGLLQATEESLLSTQALRRAISEADADSVGAFCTRLAAVRRGEGFPFTLTLDDPSGNSFVENPYVPRADPRMKVRYYVRTQAQNEALGLSAGNALDAGGSGDGDAGGAGGAGGKGALPTLQEEGEGEGEDTSPSTSDMAGSGAEAVWRNKAVDSAGLLAAARDRFLAQQAAIIANGGARGGGNSSSSSGSNVGVWSGPVHPSLASRRGRMRDMSGNVPSGFKKGGAQIRTPTVRSTLTAGALGGGGGGGGGGEGEGEGEGATATTTAPTAAPGRATSNRDASGGLLSFIFDSSSSEAAKEVMRFPVDCHNCAVPGECIMCCTDVPHFKEVILMGFSCDECGWKNVEVKGGGAVPPQGTITELKFTPPPPKVGGGGNEEEEEEDETGYEDLGRDVIKGDTAAVEIPELELELEQGSLGGLYTTVEGLLVLLKERLFESDPLGSQGGDSLDISRRTAMRDFVAGLDACIEGRKAFTLRLVDPMANSWIHSSALTEGREDPALTHTLYTRTHEEDLDLGLLDMHAPREEEEEGGGEGGQ